MDLKSHLFLQHVAFWNLWGGSYHWQISTLQWEHRTGGTWGRQTAFHAMILLVWNTEAFLAAKNRINVKWPGHIVEKTWKVPQNRDYTNHRLQISANFVSIKLKFLFALRLSLKMGIESVSISQHYLYYENVQFLVRPHRWINHTELRFGQFRVVSILLNK